MKISYSMRDNGAVQIGLPVRFDFSCHAEFRSLYERLAGAKQVTLDLATTSYIDSAALGMLLVLREKVGSTVTVQIAGAQGQPLDVLELANFGKLFVMNQAGAR